LIDFKTLLIFILLVLVSCNQNQEVRPFSKVIDPLHKSENNKPDPETVVLLELENRYVFDLIPRSINGADVLYNNLSDDNELEPLYLKSGRIRFVVKNIGTISHNIRIQNYRKDPMETSSFDMSVPSVNDFLLPGESTEFELNMWPGKFVLTCAVTNHDERGMYRPLIITPDIVHPKLTLN
jgi:hypothetical protein